MGNHEELVQFYDPALHLVPIMCGDEVLLRHLPTKIKLLPIPKLISFGIFINSGLNHYL